MNPARGAAADPSGKTPIVTTSTQQFVIALLILVIFMSIIAIISFVHVPKENGTLLTALAGGIAGWAGATISFYFPSSVGARSKDEAINKLTDQLSASPPTTTTTTTTTKKEPDADPAIPLPAQPLKEPL